MSENQAKPSRKNFFKALAVGFAASAVCLGLAIAGVWLFSR